MKNKRGGIVAIEPETGEVLALITAPSYNPNLLVGRQRSKNYKALANDTISKPLFDRALLAQYSPGSTLKPLNALVALQEKVISEKELIYCDEKYTYGKRRRVMKCHCGGGYRNLNTAIGNSCNSYFAMAFRKTVGKYKNSSQSMDLWSAHIKSFGLGNFLGNDLSVGKKGNVPDGQFYDCLLYTSDAADE